MEGAVEEGFWRGLGRGLGREMGRVIVGEGMG